MNRKERRIAEAQATRLMINVGGKPHAVEEALALAIRAYQAGDAKAAENIYLRVLAKAPDYPDAHSNLGVLLHDLKRYAEALASYGKAIALKPDYAEAYNNRGVTLHALKRFAEALADYDKAIALKPTFAEAHNGRGNALRELKRFDEALFAYAQAITCKPDYAEAYQNRGLMLVNIGNMPEAEAMFRKALALRPGFAHPLFALAGMRKYKDAEHEDIRRIQQLLQAPNLAASDKEQLSFALGKIYDDCGRYDEAFQYFRQANEIRNASASYDAEATHRAMDAIIETFSREFLSQKFAYSSPSGTPIFIVGMPRSGTTLLASILSNHPQVGNAGELPTMAELVSRLKGYPQSARQLAPEAASAMIAEYKTSLRRNADANVPHVIDKHPFNFRHLGLISMLFPQARIIHCTRNPMDTALSNYFQRFALEYGYCFDLGNIAHYLREYARLMRHWQGALPAPILEISYEAMVTDTEAEARRALEFLGLGWDVRCLAPHTNRYAVDTASNWQVRQPVNRQSIGRWRHYEKHLASLKEMFEL